MTVDEYYKLVGVGRPKRTNRDAEHQLQCECVKWFRYTYPDLHFRLFAVPNGGVRDAATASKLKAEGVVSGVSDLILLKRNSTYGALLIEMKISSRSSRQSPAQKTWQLNLEKYGEYKYVLCRSFDDFRSAVTQYLNS